MRQVMAKPMVTYEEYVRELCVYAHVSTNVNVPIHKEKKYRNTEIQCTEMEIMKFIRLFGCFMLEVTRKWEGM